MRFLERCLILLLFIAIAGTVLFYSTNVPNSDLKSNSGLQKLHKPERLKSSQRRINHVTKRPTKEQVLLAEIERANKTRLILDSLGSRNTSDLVMPFEDTVVIQPYQHLSDGQKPFAVILVTSLAEDTERRDGIRQTWYSWGAELQCLVYFFMGSPRNETLEIILEEADLYGDIIVDDLSESYYKLPIKTLRMLKWYLSAYKNDPPSFFIKTDDDVFLNLPLVIDYLKKVKQEHFIGGMRYANSTAHRDPHSKWYVPESVYPEKIFPTYAAGPCYFIDGGLVEQIYTESFQVPLIHLEDVYLLGLVANQRLNLTISDVSNIVEDAHASKAVIRSRFRFKKTLVFHPIKSAAEMKKLFQKIISPFRNFRRKQYFASSKSRVMNHYHFYLYIFPLQVILLTFTWSYFQ